jgi:hypothetical protein
MIGNSSTRLVLARSGGRRRGQAAWRHHAHRAVRLSTALVLLVPAERYWHADVVLG